MDVNKKLPVWALALLDLLLVAAIIFPFAIFHHVGDMWGWWGEESAGKGYAAEVAVFDDSLFLKNGEEPVVLNKDEEIRAYAAEAKLTVPDAKEATLLSFYRSPSLCVTLYSVREEVGKENAKAHKFFIYDVFVKSVKNFFTVSGKQKGMHELIADGEELTGGKLVAAVNGDYSSNKNHCRVVVRNGELFRNAGEYDSDLCVMFADGSVQTYEYKDFDFAAVEAKDPWQIWDFGPELLDKNGRAKQEFDESAYDTHILSRRHPRTALGYYEPGHYCFVIADGRQKDEDGVTDLEGVTINELADLMQALGCKTAYNMDGGDSTQAYMNGQDVRIDRTRDPQRVLSDIICVGEVAEDPSGANAEKAEKAGKKGE